MTTHPEGHCRCCGEPLLFRPYLNCQRSGRASVRMAGSAIDG